MQAFVVFFLRFGLKIDALNIERRKENIYQWIAPVMKVKTRASRTYSRWCRLKKRRLVSSGTHQYRITVTIAIPGKQWDIFTGFPLVCARNLLRMLSWRTFMVFMACRTAVTKQWWIIRKLEVFGEDEQEVERLFSLFLESFVLNQVWGTKNCKGQ